MVNCTGVCACAGTQPITVSKLLVTTKQLAAYRNQNPNKNMRKHLSNSCGAEEAHVPLFRRIDETIDVRGLILKHLALFPMNTISKLQYVLNIEVLYSSQVP